MCDAPDCPNAMVGYDADGQWCAEHSSRRVMGAADTRTRELYAKVLTLREEILTALLREIIPEPGRAALMLASAELDNAVAHLRDMGRGTS
jgi:hypothetical protein